MWFRICLLGVCFIDYAQAAYDPEDILKLNAGLGYQYDSNLFKLDENINNTQTNKMGKRSDSKLEARLGGRLDLTISRQLLTINADINQISYQNFSDLNHNDWNAGLTWNWLVGSTLSGKLIANTSTRMSSFEDDFLSGSGNSVLDMQRQNSLNWQGTLQLKSSIAIIASAGTTTEKHDLKEYINAKSDVASIGMQYQSEKGNFIAARHSWRKYTYDQDLPFRAGFTEQTSSIDIGYAPSSKIDLNASVGLSQWESALNGQSQNTPQGDLALVWRATSKSIFRMSYGQSFAEFTSGAGRNLDQRMNLNAKWLMTERTDWTIDFNHRDRSLEVVGSRSANDESTDSLRLALSYRALKPLTISSYVQAEQRKSDVRNGNYKDYQFGFNARFDY
ncbi:hypothetical protein [Janthinobacterium sp. B9-8]|uniref:hypothetical protein n=1 Tax=Janthinobacterium sp. B9-8 TaxID=1236179 RepID=UPI00061D04B7|nr:hypothetical protein [Janthinobacterium sp. B9-8]AMC36789.1 hypothetical protein VN23_20445 [Janthinobacterium sp. B9-8]